MQVLEYRKNFVKRKEPHSILGVVLLLLYIDIFLLLLYNNCAMFGSQFMNLP